MRRFFLFVILTLLLLGLCVSVSAAPSAPKIQYFATVTGDSRCQVNMTVTMHITQDSGDLIFPVPADAGSITVNGSRVFPSRSQDKRNISLRRFIGKSTGDITFTLSYTLPDVVHTSELGTLELQLPMLSGLDCTVEQFEFSVALPTALDALPGFVSGYHQAGIEEYLTYQVEGNTITGSTFAVLKDHETLSMKLSVTEELFPQGLTELRDWSAGTTAMMVCGVLALLYWLLCLRFLPLGRERCTEMPDGYTAGDLGSILHLQGTDLTMTVLSWARLGYVLLEVDRSGRVRIHKRMDMGNERKEAERKLFRALFSRRTIVDTAGSHYAQLCLEAAKKPRGLSEFVRKGSGNPLVFRLLASGIGLFGGVCIAIAMGSGAVLQGLLILALGIFGLISGYIIQAWGRCLTIHDPAQLTLSLSLCAVWLLLGLLCGMFPTAIGMVLSLLAAGWLFAWSGRRSEQGKHLAAQIQGLKYYLTKEDAYQFQQLCSRDSDYFFDLAPSALALGKAQAFAKRLGNLTLEDCPYLMGHVPRSGTAAQWVQILQGCVSSMNRRRELRPLENLSQLVRGLWYMIFKR